MKKILILVLVLSTMANLFAQSKGYQKGENLLNVGIGVNSYYSGGIPIGFSYEKGISDVISVGGNIDYLSHKYKYGQGLSNKFTSLYFGVRGSYHVADALKIESDKVDLYLGATIGYRTFSWKDNYSGTSLGNAYSTGVFLGGYIGGKYYFSNKAGIFTELGAIGSTNARIGVAFKL